MISFIKSLQFLFKPNYWLMNNPYSKHWDELLNHLMDDFEPVLSEPNALDGYIYTVNFDNVSVWIENYPYGYATAYDLPTEMKSKISFEGRKGYIGRYGDVRPSRLTILRLRNLVNGIKIKAEVEASVDQAYQKVLEGYLNERN